MRGMAQVIMREKSRWNKYSRGQWVHGKNVKISYFDLHFQKDQFLKCFVSIPKCKVVFFTFIFFGDLLKKLCFCRKIYPNKCIKKVLPFETSYLLGSSCAWHVLYSCKWLDNLRILAIVFYFNHLFGLKFWLILKMQPVPFGCLNKILESW